MNGQRVEKALIVGGGIAGPATAIGLQKVGIESVVYERYPETSDRQGVFLTLGSNGLDALRTIGAADGALAKGFPTSEIALRSTTGQLLGSTPISTSRDTALTSHAIRRSDLYAALHEEAITRRVRIEYDKGAVDLVEMDDRVRVRFSDGREAEGDIIIGCDGVNSMVREKIDPAAPAPTYAGLIGLGGYAEGVPLETAKGGYEMIFGKNAFFGYAVAPGGEVWWFANIPRSDEPGRGEVEAIGEPEWRARLLDLFADDAGPAVSLIEATAKFGTASPIHTIPHLPVWHSKRMVLVGDAAHAPSPSSGQGASLAIEDALVLAKCLRDVSDPVAAFGRFEEIRRPRVEKIIKNAARVNSNKTVDGVARVLRDLFLPTILKLVARGSHVERTYGHHIDWDESVPTSV